jgi:hypothetical protein
MPRLSASDAVALGTELLAEADAGGALPAGFERARGRLEEALERLRAAHSVLEDAPVIDVQAVSEADRELDAAWSALYSFLQGWAKLPRKDEERGAAEQLLKAIYPNGLKFTLLTFKLEWAESKARLERLEDEPCAGLLARLGGTPFRDELRTALAAYGEALRVGGPERARATTAHEHAPLDEFVEALRGYVLQASAHGEHAEGDARARAEALLAPFATWLARARAGKADRRASGPPPPSPPDGEEPPDEAG